MLFTSQQIWAPGPYMGVVESSAQKKNEQIFLRGLVMIDVYRNIEGKMELIYHHESSNVITNFGLVLIQRWLGGTTSGAFQWTTILGGNNLWYTTSAPNKIALSIDSTDINATHGSWQAVDNSYPTDIEITTGGLARATSSTVTINSAYSPGLGSTKGSATYAISQTFTCQTGFNFVGVNKTGLFAGAYNTNSGATNSVPISGLIAENTFPALDLQPGDQIAITWRITI
jgi:hypothetical protein